MTNNLFRLKNQNLRIPLTQIDEHDETADDQDLNKSSDLGDVLFEKRATYTHVDSNKIAGRQDKNRVNEVHLDYETDLLGTGKSYPF